MNKDSMKKAGVVTIAVLMLLYCSIVPILWFVLEVPVSVCVAVAVPFGLVALVVLYHARERIREIEEGLDDAVDNY